MIVFVLVDDRGYVECEFAMHVGEGSGHLTDVLEDDMMSMDRCRE